MNALAPLASRSSSIFQSLGQGPSLLEDLGEALARGIVLLDLEGRISEWSARGRRLLQAYFPGWSAETRVLPDRLAHWLPGTAGETFEVAGAAGQLTVRVINRKAAGEFLLILEEEQEKPRPEVLRSLGLTPREAMVATWLAQGKTNPEIAIILNANVLTIRVHVLHIFAKLGVETRTAAALRIGACWRAAG